jgi:hypothetical protein
MSWAQQARAGIRGVGDDVGASSGGRENKQGEIEFHTAGRGACGMMQISGAARNDDLGNPPAVRPVLRARSLPH